MSWEPGGPGAPQDHQPEPWLGSAVLCTELPVPGPWLSPGFPTDVSHLQRELCCSIFFLLYFLLHKSHLFLFLLSESSILSSSPFLLEFMELLKLSTCSLCSFLRMAAEVSGQAVHLWAARDFPGEGQVWISVTAGQIESSSTWRLWCWSENLNYLDFPVWASSLCYGEWLAVPCAGHPDASSGSVLVFAPGKAEHFERSSFKIPL